MIDYVKPWQRTGEKAGKYQRRAHYPMAIRVPFLGLWKPL